MADSKQVKKPSKRQIKVPDTDKRSKPISGDYISQEEALRYHFYGVKNISRSKVQYIQFICRSSNRFVGHKLYSDMLYREQLKTLKFFGLLQREY